MIVVSAAIRTMQMQAYFVDALTADIIGAVLASVLAGSMLLIWWRGRKP